MTYKLYYFNIRGLAEPIRLLFVDQGIQFEDIQFPKDEKWEETKKQFAFGQVPCLKDGDFEIPQTGAILRHLGRKLNLIGATEEELTFADFLAEGVKDVRMKYAKMVYHEFETKEQFLKDVYPGEMAKLDRLLKKHANGEKFILGEKLTYADYVLFEELDVALIVSPTSLDAFPVLKAYHDRFAARPNLKEYLAKRTITVNIVPRT